MSPELSEPVRLGTPTGLAALNRIVHDAIDAEIKQEVKWQVTQTLIVKAMKVHYKHCIIQLSEVYIYVMSGY